ncbi:DUF2937 family protein [Maritalea mediterranea]|uniref:DUF2937 family protein n=1 Tax=Maritalea mediterranea TaxID=2909667 RepID=A0ABS9E2W6_9HYPH|nr:DUF2937 family protein [Maritalea mediterranea]MCF4097196.1 DUF2937 family protein [Maritalea mediterranea]
MRGLIFIMFFALGGFVGAQFPGFTSQYEQRLDGAIEELRTIIERFDRDAAEQDLTRAEALDKYAGTNDEFLIRQGTSMQQIFARYEKLTNHQAALQNANIAEQAIGFVQYFDPELAQATWAQYDPNVPLNAEGGLFAALGGVIAWLTAAGSWAIARLPLRYRRRIRISGE